MNARESWTKRRAQRPEREDAALGRTLPAGPMTAAHHCDRCGAQAYVRILLHGGRDLLFCAHHYRQHAPALARVALAVQDETQRLARGGWPG